MIFLPFLFFLLFFFTTTPRYLIPGLQKGIRPHKLRTLIKDWGKEGKWELIDSWEFDKENGTRVMNKNYKAFDKIFFDSNKILL